MVLASEDCRASSDRTVDRDNRDPGCVEELVKGRVGGDRLGQSVDPRLLSVTVIFAAAQDGLGGFCQ